MSGVMAVDLQVTFRGMNPSPSVEERVREKAAKMSHFYDRILSSHAIVEAPDRHRSKGGVFRVTLHVAVPGKELVVNREPGDVEAHEDVMVAVRDAFDAMYRQLEDFARKLRAHG